eukprot:scaffold36038_cov48-Phaeocystis_antarctica.AAC.2
MEGDVGARFVSVVAGGRSGGELGSGGDGGEEVGCCGGGDGKGGAGGATVRVAVAAAVAAAADLLHHLGHLLSLRLGRLLPRRRLLALRLGGLALKGQLSRATKAAADALDLQGERNARPHHVLQLAALERSAVDAHDHVASQQLARCRGLPRWFDLGDPVGGIEPQTEALLQAALQLDCEATGLDGKLGDQRRGPPLAFKGRPPGRRRRRRRRRCHRRLPSCSRRPRRYPRKRLLSGRGWLGSTRFIWLHRHRLRLARFGVLFNHGQAHHDRRLGVSRLAMIEVSIDLVHLAARGRHFGRSHRHACHRERDRRTGRVHRGRRVSVVAVAAVAAVAAIAGAGGSGLRLLGSSGATGTAPAAASPCPGLFLRPKEGRRVTTAAVAAAVAAIAGGGGSAVFDSSGAIGTAPDTAVSICSLGCFSFVLVLRPKESRRVTTDAVAAVAAIAGGGSSGLLDLSGATGTAPAAASPCAGLFLRPKEARRVTVAAVAAVASVAPLCLSTRVSSPIMSCIPPAGAGIGPGDERCTVCRGSRPSAFAVAAASVLVVSPPPPSSDSAPWLPCWSTCRNSVRNAGLELPPSCLPP